jgi:Kef-type K+ transport system membrane component KefB
MACYDCYAANKHGNKVYFIELTQRIFKFSSAEGWVIFGLSTTEAAATLAATLVGYRLKIIGDDVLNGVILMILITCIIGPMVVEFFGKQIVQKKSNSKLQNIGFKHIYSAFSILKQYIN